MCVNALVVVACKGVCGRVSRTACGGTGGLRGRMCILGLAALIVSKGTTVGLRLACVTVRTVLPLPSWNRQRGPILRMCRVDRTSVRALFGRLLTSFILTRLAIGQRASLWARLLLVMIIMHGLTLTLRSLMLLIASGFVMNARLSRFV